MLGPHPASCLAIDRHVELGPGRLPYVLVVLAQLGVALDHVDQMLDRGRGDAGGLEPFGELPLVVTSGPRSKELIELVLVLFAGVVRRES